MNLMGYDAMALGPAELALGEALLQERFRDAGFAVLSANLLVPSRGTLLARAYVVLTVRQRRAGIIALTSREPVWLAGKSAAAATRSAQAPTYRGRGCGLTMT